MSAEYRGEEVHVKSHVKEGIKEVQSKGGGHKGSTFCRFYNFISVFESIIIFLFFLFCFFYFFLFMGREGSL